MMRLRVFRCNEGVVIAQIDNVVAKGDPGSRAEQV